MSLSGYGVKLGNDVKLPGSARLLKPDEACEILGINKPMLYQLSSRGAIRKVKLGACLRFRLYDLQEFVDL